MDWVFFNLKGYGICYIKLIKIYTDGIFTFVGSADGKVYASRDFNFEVFQKKLKKASVIDAFVDTLFYCYALPNFEEVKQD